MTCDAMRPPNVRAPADPLFDAPYEPAAVSAEAPAWERKEPVPARNAVSPSIRPKRKVASLLGGGKT